MIPLSLKGRLDVNGPGLHLLAVLALAMVLPRCAEDAVPPPDSGVPPDLVVPSDLPLPDRALPDFPLPDRAKPDLPLPDLRPPDSRPPDTRPPDLPRLDLPPLDVRPPDLQVPDLLTPDLGPPAKGKVLYMHGYSYTSMTLYEVNTDGTGKVMRMAPGMGFDIDPMTMQAARNELSTVTRGRPQNLDNVVGTFQPVRLPSGVRLFHVRSFEAGQWGQAFVSIGPSGKSTLLSHVPGSSEGTQTYQTYVAVNGAGTMMAAVRAYYSTNTDVHLIKLDGSTFGGGAKVCALATKPGIIRQVSYKDMIFGAKNFYFVARDPQYRNTLYRAPLDCSAKAAPVSLPNVGGHPGQDALATFAGAADGSKIVFQADGKLTSSQDRDVIVVDDSTGVATNLSNDPATYLRAGCCRYLMTSGKYGQLIGVSPTGKYTAYIRHANLRHELFVRDTKAAKPAVHVNRASNFSGAVREMASPEWITDDELVFWAGASDTTMDMYRYTVSTGALSNLTGSSGTTKPFAGGGALRPLAGWWSQGSKFFYYLQGNDGAGTWDLAALDTAGFTVKLLTKGLFVSSMGENFDAAAKGGKAFFYAKAPGSSVHNLYVFDQLTASVPKQLTNFPASGGAVNIYDVTANSDGTLVAFGAGPKYDAQHMYVVDASGAVPKLAKLTAKVGCLTDVKVFSPDNKLVVYGSGHSYGKQDLRIQPVGGGAYKQLQSLLGFVSPVMVN